MICLPRAPSSSGDKLPDNAAEDSFSFLPAALGQSTGSASRTNLVNHSVHGEFAYREKNWKIVFKMPGKDIGIVARETGRR